MPASMSLVKVITHCSYVLATYYTVLVVLHPLAALGWHRSEPFK